MIIGRVNVAENLIQRKLDGGTEDAETAGRGIGDVFSVIHSTGKGRASRE